MNDAVRHGLVADAQRACKQFALALAAKLGDAPRRYDDAEQSEPPPLRFVCIGGPDDYEAAAEQIAAECLGHGLTVFVELPKELERDGQDTVCCIRVRSKVHGIAARVTEIALGSYEYAVGGRR